MCFLVVLQVCGFRCFVFSCLFQFLGCVVCVSLFLFFVLLDRGFCFLFWAFLVYFQVPGCGLLFVLVFVAGFIVFRFLFFLVCVRFAGFCCFSWFSGSPIYEIRFSRFFRFTGLVGCCFFRFAVVWLLGVLVFVVVVSAFRFLFFVFRLLFFRFLVSVFSGLVFQFLFVCWFPVVFVFFVCFRFPFFSSFCSFLGFAWFLFRMSVFDLLFFGFYSRFRFGFCGCCLVFVLVVFLFFGFSWFLFRFCFGLFLFFSGFAGFLFFVQVC